MKAIQRLILPLVLLSCWNASSQMFEAKSDTSEKESFIIQPSRIEFEWQLSDRDYYVVTAEDRGLLVIQNTQIRASQGFVWYLHMLDTGLNVLWKKQVTVKFGHSILGHDFNSRDFVLLFSTDEFRSEEMLALKVSLDGDDLRTYEFDTVLPLELSHFEVVGDGLIFGGESSGRPVIVFYDIKTGRPKVLPGIYNAKSSIIGIETSDQFKMFSVLISEKTKTSDYSITLKVFSSEGEMVYTSTLQTQREKSLVDAVSTNFKNGVQYVSGTYSSKRTERSVGFYLARIQNGKQLFIKYHPYADLYNFFSYMPEKRKKRVKRKIERKKIKGKKLKLNYRLLVHDIIRRGDEYILIGEAYYPRYSSNTTSGQLYYDPFMAPQTSSAYNSDRFIGYQYTHAVVVSFNDEGDILWDDSFEINDVLLPTLEKNVQVTVEEDRVVLLYAYDNMIRSKVLGEGDIIEGKSFDPIELTHENDKVRKGNFGIEGLKEWYDDVFYAFGTHRIRNSSDRAVKLNRKVFYINKVTFK